jgi:hypothetical protein
MAAALEEGQLYERWLTQGEGRPFWPHTHPSRVTDALRLLWDPGFAAGGRANMPVQWELGAARQFLQPLGDIPAFIRRSALQEVAQAVDHLLQSPTNPLSPQIRKLTPEVWSYRAKGFRLAFSPRVVKDGAGRERRYVFLLWLAPALPERNPFA